MAAPTASYIQLPIDTGNTGKKVRSQTRVVGSDTAHEHFFIPVSKRGHATASDLMSARYSYHSGLQSVLASAHTPASTAFLYVVNTSSTFKVALRRMEHQFGTLAGAAMASNPRIVLARFTSTGTLSGAAITGAKLDSADPSANVIVSAVVTGLTATVGTIFRGVPVPAKIGTVTNAVLFMGDPIVWDFPDERNQIILRQNEGFVLYQADAGTASDDRKFTTDFILEEFEG